MSIHKTLLRPVLGTKPWTNTIRLASTTTSSSTVPSSSEQTTLTWPQYLSLRHRRRIVSQVASVPTTFAAFFGGAAYFGSLEMDPTQPIFGIDPMFVYGGAT
jgi:import inner membrane translocase subunit TIM23